MKKDFKIFVGGKLMTVQEAKSEGWNLDYDLEMLRLWGYYDASGSEEGNQEVRKEVRRASDILKQPSVRRMGKTKAKLRNLK